VAKGTVVTTGTETISIPLQEATAHLIENLQQSEPFLRYQEADRKLHADAEAMQLLADLSELQQKIRGQQYSGVLFEGDLARLRELQSAVRRNASIQAQEQTQALAVSFLREINQEISQLLGIDFASLARRSSGCC
jgi:cell fate (sporulation/competence/biofilm development) regulator YlbF (YheA/YmcA/DUF963 family)